MIALPLLFGLEDLAARAAAIGARDLRFRGGALALSVLVALPTTLRELPAGTRIFADRLWSNWLLWEVQEARVFVDGRNREYPPEIHQAALAIMAGDPATGEILDASGTEVVLADPGWAERAGLDSWRSTFTDGRCAVFRK